MGYQDLTFNNKKQSLGNSGAYEIPAKEVDAAPDDTTVEVKIDAPNGESRSFDVHTIRGVKKYQRRAAATTTAYRYQHDFPQVLWTDGILFIGVELIEPQYYVVRGQKVGCDWQYDAGMTQSGTLNPLNGFNEGLAKTIRAMADGTLDSQVGARICNGLGIMRACLETQKLEQLEARMDEIADRIAHERTGAARDRTSTHEAQRPSH
jgi:hypothetical protein